MRGRAGRMRARLVRRRRSLRQKPTAHLSACPVRDMRRSSSARRRTSGPSSTRRCSTRSVGCESALTPTTTSLYEHFDVLHYLLQSPRAPATSPTSTSIEHFLEHGLDQRLSPDPDFSMGEYLARHPRKTHRGPRAQPVPRVAEAGQGRGRDRRPGARHRCGWPTSSGWSPQQVVDLLAERPHRSAGAAAHRHAGRDVREGGRDRTVDRRGLARDRPARCCCRSAPPTWSGEVSALHARPGGRGLPARAPGARDQPAALGRRPTAWRATSPTPWRTTSTPARSSSIYTDAGAARPRAAGSPTGCARSTSRPCVDGPMPEDGRRAGPGRRCSASFRRRRGRQHQLPAALPRDARPTAGRWPPPSGCSWCFFCNEQTARWAAGTAGRLRYFYRYLRPGRPASSPTASTSRLSCARRHQLRLRPRRPAPRLPRPVDPGSRSSPSRRRPPGRRPQVFWAGRWDRQKRIDLLLEVARRMPDVDFRMWGEPVLHAGSVGSAARQRRRSRGATPTSPSSPLGRGRRLALHLRLGRRAEPAARGRDDRRPDRRHAWSAGPARCSARTTPGRCAEAEDPEAYVDGDPRRCSPTRTTPGAARWRCASGCCASAPRRSSPSRSPALLLDRDDARRRSMSDRPHPRW